MNEIRGYIWKIFQRRINIVESKYVSESSATFWKIKIVTLVFNKCSPFQRARNNSFYFICQESASHKNKPRKRCLFTWEFTRKMHIKLYVEKYSDKWYLTVTDDVVSLKKESDSNELQKSFIWIPAQRQIGGTSSRNFPSDSLKYNSPCGSRLKTCKERYSNCSNKRQLEKFKIKSLNDKKEMLQQQLEEVQRELRQLKKAKNVQFSPQS